MQAEGRGAAREDGDMNDFDPRRCPLCGGTNTHWRSGVGFEGERRCVDCKRAYDPDEEWEKWRKQEEERQERNTHRE